MDQSTHEVAGPINKSKAAFRTDINGLRALAVIPVVGFHAGLLAIPGGFIGVDIFYVISGFLITRILLREAETTGRLALGRFWAKRLRRLVPALALVVGVTLPSALLISSPLVWDNLARDAMASMLYVSNFVFAFDSTDYFADDLTQSPLLHTWSLGVEEQFYGIWPLLVLLSVLIAKKTTYALRPLLALLFVAIIVISFVLSILVTELRQGIAFYLLPTRAWEFAAGGLLSILPGALLAKARASSSSFSLIGVALLVGGFLMIQDHYPFPGSLAAVPVVGTLMIIAAGGGLPQSKNAVSAVLDSPILQWVGTRSYSWYLWHWPAIVLAGVLFQSNSVWIKGGACLFSLFLAALTYRFVENRFRYSSRLRNSTKLTFIAAGGCVLVASIFAGIAVAAAGSIASTPPYTKFAQARSVVSDQSCDRIVTSAEGHALCEMGDLNSQKTIMLMGDSHAGQWKAAMSEAATANGVRLLVRWMSACPASGLKVLTANGHRIKGCKEFHAETLAIVQEERPSAVVLAQSVDYAGKIISDDGRQLSDQHQADLWRSAFTDTIAELRGASAQVGFIEDNPGTTFDSLLCETRFLPATKNCSSTRDSLLSEPLRRIDADVIASAGVEAVYSPTNEICGMERCSVVTEDGVPIYRDRTHLSEQWTRTQIPKLKHFLSTLLSQTPS